MGWRLRGFGYSLSASMLFSIGSIILSFFLASIYHQARPGVPISLGQIDKMSGCQFGQGRGDFIRKRKKKNRL